ncbi:hypothetical protein EDF65_3768 [Chryseobacterium nakagawai]|nr:hypothetical protein EDF65_3768 [Chryseobacterium nakagawai]
MQVKTFNYLICFLTITLKTKALPIFFIYLSLLIKQNFIMKNLKKFTKTDLKKITAGNAPCCEPWGRCPDGYKQCQEWGACVPKSVNCGG